MTATIPDIDSDRLHATIGSAVRAAHRSPHDPATDMLQSAWVEVLQKRTWGATPESRPAEVFTVAHRAARREAHHLRRHCTLPPEASRGFVRMELRVCAAQEAGVPLSVAITEQATNSDKRQGLTRREYLAARYGLPDPTVEMDPAALVAEQAASDELVGRVRWAISGLPDAEARVAAHFLTCLRENGVMPTQRAAAEALGVSQRCIRTTIAHLRRACAGLLDD